MLSHSVLVHSFHAFPTLPTQTKHVKPQSKEEAGQVMQQEYPIHHSNVAHYSEAQKVASRVGHK